MVFPCAWAIYTDGSAINGMGSGGGVLLDNDGSLIRAFSNFYGPGINTMAEIQALRDGLQMCRDLALESVLVESDSLVAVLALKELHASPWKYDYEIRVCKALLGTYLIEHVFREKNTVADRLAAHAHAHRNAEVYVRTQDLPRAALHMLAKDRFGFSTFRA